VENRKKKSRRGAGNSRSFAHSKNAGAGKAPSRRPLGQPPEGLFRDIVLAPERDRLPEAKPVLSVSKDDDLEFLEEVSKREEARIVLKRRGMVCGEVAVLARDGLVPPRPRRRRREVIQRERWGAASPIFLPGALTGARASLASAGLDKLFDELHTAGGIARFLERRRGRLGPEFAALPLPAKVFDLERDIERVLQPGHGDERELWLKTGRLSTFEGDRSLRLRISFGEEGDDDASSDEEAHRRVGQLAARLLPAARSLAGTPELSATLRALTGRKLFMTQHIAYWNAPEGGARFHHDAFDEQPGSGQLGVVYAQLTGKTLWLALSIEDMHRRVREFIGWLEAGDMPWLREALAPGWQAIVAAVKRREPCLSELAKPDCGVFGAFIDGREFTAHLADAGHAVLLEPGDVLVLPNHGLQRTAMHSVFCASTRPGYALSVALRGDGPAPELSLPDPEFHDAAPVEDEGTEIG